MSRGAVIPWFDQADFERARAALADRITHLAHADTHEEFTRLVEQELRTVAAVRVGDVRVRGVARIDLDRLTEWARVRDARLDDVDVFDDFLDEQVEAGDVIEWPPGRNERCWCGSGTKYKRCCSALTIDERVVAEQAARLRDTMYELSTMDAHRGFTTVDDLLDEFDELALELHRTASTDRADLLEEIRYDVIGGSHYPVLLALARESAAEDVDAAHEELRLLLDHELLAAAHPPLADHLRLSYAEALRTAGRHHAALALATHAIEHLRSTGTTVDVADLAITATYQLGTDGPDAAHRALEAVLATADPADRGLVCEIAADHFDADIEYPLAAMWAERHVRTLLDAGSPPLDEMQRATAMLRRIYTAADEFADEHPGEPRVTHDQALLDEASGWLSTHDIDR